MRKKDIQFEWDDHKNTANIFKHGIDFWDAAYIWNHCCPVNNTVITSGYMISTAPTCNFGKENTT